MLAGSVSTPEAPVLMLQYGSDAATSKPAASTKLTTGRFITQVTTRAQKPVRTSAAFSGRIVDASGFGVFSLTGRMAAPAGLSTVWRNIAPGTYNLLVPAGGGEKAYPFTVLEGQVTTVVVN